MFSYMFSYAFYAVLFRERLFIFVCMLFFGRSKGKGANGKSVFIVRSAEQIIGRNGEIRCDREQIFGRGKSVVFSPFVKIRAREGHALRDRAVRYLPFFAQFFQPRGKRRGRRGRDKFIFLRTSQKVGEGKFQRIGDFDQRPRGRNDPEQRGAGDHGQADARAFGKCPVGKTVVVLHDRKDALSERGRDPVFRICWHSRHVSANRSVSISVVCSAEQIIGRNGEEVGKL